MSDPRMIPADEALGWVEHLEAAGMTKSPEYRRWACIVALHEQVEQQDETVQTLSRLLADAERASIARAAQIERVREVLAWAEQSENRAHADWIATADTHHRDTALAYTQAVTWLRYALGDTDE